MDSKKTMTRSPGYPFFGLEEAILKARAVWTHAQRQSISVEKVAVYWKYAPKSSGWRLALAALKRFGLLESVGSKKSGEVKLTDLAFKIIHDTREQSSERDAALKEAALRPTIYNELWHHWNGQLPSDDTIRTYLLLDKEFNEASIQGFLTDFRKTIAFAKLTTADTIVAAGEAADEDNDEEVVERDEPQRRRPRSRAMQTEQGLQQATFPLNGGEALVQWPEGLSADDAAEFEDWLQLVIRKVKRTVIPEQSQQRPRLRKAHETTRHMNSDEPPIVDEDCNFMEDPS